MLRRIVGWIEYGLDTASDFMYTPRYWRLLTIVTWLSLVVVGSAVAFFERAGDTSLYLCCIGGGVPMMVLSNLHREYLQDQLDVYQSSEEALSTSIIRPTT
jgi:hypothetical protein